MFFTMPLWKLVNPPYKFKWTERTILVAEGSSETTIEGYMENYKNVSQDIKNQLDAEAEAMWKAIEMLKQGESINVHDLETNLYWEFGKFTSRDGETLKSYCSRFYKMMNEHVRNQCDVINHQVNVPGKAIVKSPPPTYDQELAMVAEDDEMSKEKEIDKLMALISLSFKKIYKPTNNLKNSSNTSRANQDNNPRINRITGYDNQRAVNVTRAKENVGTQVVQQSGIQCYNCKEYGHVAKECQKTKREKDAAYHKEKMLFCKQEEAGFQLNAEQADWRDDTDDEPEDQELEAHYLYMAQIQEVQNNDDNYNMFANDREHPEQPESVNDTYPDEQGDTNITTDSLDMSNNGGEADQDEDDDLARERDLLASLIEKLKCKIDESKERNKLLESSNQTLVDKLKSEIEISKTKINV
ncbi:integrase, catalytic region, zinc finger, CCHC-type containing protein [Tanacetum coccineum]